MESARLASLTPPTSFASRLEMVLAGRTPTTWCRCLGILPNMMTRMKQGHIPGHEVLTRIMRAENVSLSWLMEGVGQPFIAHGFLEFRDFELALRQHLTRSHDVIHLLDSAVAPVVIMRAHPADHAYLGTIEVLSTPWQPNLRALLESCLSRAEARYHFLPEEDTRAIRQGLVGTFRICGDETIRGLLDQPGRSGVVPFSTTGKAELSSIREDQEVYKLDSRLMRAILKGLEDTCEAVGLALDHEQKARAITALFRHACRVGLAPEELDSHLMLSIIEAV